MKSTKCLLVAAVLALGGAATGAQADELLFTLSGPDGSASWTQSSNPTPVYDVSGEFTIIDVAANGLDSNGNPVGLVEFDASGFFGGLCTNAVYSNGGYGCSYGSTISEYGPVIYTGTEADPVFAIGTFDFDAYVCGNLGCSLEPNGETLTVTEDAVPEPDTLALLGVALLGLAGFAALRRRRPALV